MHFHRKALALETGSGHTRTLDQYINFIVKTSHSVFNRFKESIKSCQYSSSSIGSGERIRSC